MQRASSSQPSLSQTALEDVARLARESGVFGGVSIEGPAVVCKASAQPDAAFRLGLEDASHVSVAWVCADRYISQSIEADLMWTGDDLGELIDEELADQGYRGEPIGRVEHYRDPQKLFTFRSLVPRQAVEAGAAVLVKFLLAYEAAFRDLGDMKPDEDDQ